MKKENESWGEYTDRAKKEHAEKVDRVASMLRQNPECVSEFVRAAYRQHDAMEQWEDDWRDDICCADSKDDVGGKGSLMHATFVLDEYLEGVVPGDVWDWIKKQWPNDVKEFEDNLKRRKEEEAAKEKEDDAQEVIDAKKHVASIFVSTHLPRGPMDRILHVGLFEGNVNWERVFETLLEEFPEEKANLKAKVVQRLADIQITKTK